MYLIQKKRIIDRNQNSQRVEIIVIESYFNHSKQSNLSFDKNNSMILLKLLAKKDFRVSFF